MGKMPSIQHMEKTIPIPCIDMNVSEYINTSEYGSPYSLPKDEEIPGDLIEFKESMC